MGIISAACTKQNYDFKEAGFSSEAEMEEMHKLGYHSKAKVGEMVLIRKLIADKNLNEKNDSKNQDGASGD